MNDLRRELKEARNLLVWLATPNEDGKLKQPSITLLDVLGTVEKALEQPQQDTLTTPYLARDILDEDVLEDEMIAPLTKVYITDEPIYTYQPSLRRLSDDEIIDVLKSVPNIPKDLDKKFSRGIEMANAIMDAMLKPKGSE